ncbi:MAG: M28 family metallopeptidase [Pseudomonadota bacterium]
MLRFQMLASVLALGLSACAEPVPADEAGYDAADVTTPAATAEAWPTHQATEAEITVADFRYRVQTLSDDRFEGRAPASATGERSAQWIAEEMDAIGMEPAGLDGSWYQPVPLIEATLDEERSSFDISVNGEPMGLRIGPDVVYWTQNPTEEVSIAASDLVFVGYGVVAPEYGWDDYAGVDMTGKTAVMLVNDPGFANPEGEAFNGEAMTYYGRWTYKYEEAARQGAAGAIVIHQTEPASYPWEVVRSSWSGAQFTLEREGELELVDVQSWIHVDPARRLFASVGLDFDALAQAAAEPGFTPVPLEGASADAQLFTGLRTLSSNNVAGRIEGAVAPDEHVLLMAHWDHLGTRLNFSGEDQIYNGAIDNASGTTAVLEIAEKIAKSDTPPARSIIVVAVTAEESGLLGSQWYAENPLVPLNETVAGFNFDGMLPIGPTEDIVVIGYGASELEPLLADVASGYGKYLTPDPNSEAGYFYRSDHVTLARQGVPMLYADSGSIHVERGAEYGAQVEAAYRLEAYHKPADEYDPQWDLTGFEQDTRLMHDVVRRLADSEDWPNWYEGNEFRALRDAMMAERED